MIVARKVDWKGVVKNVIDSYPLGIAHGLQKDAIQNGWDACKPKTNAHVSNNWGMKFELVNRGEAAFLVIEDFGTTGLTGKKTSSDYSDDEMPPEDERWAKWESYASGKTAEDTLGERGQGKMLYAASSKKHTLYYDSYREDGSYRAGWTNVSTLERWDGEEAKRKIEALGFSRLFRQGSRFIIVDPTDDVIKSIKSGEFVSYISETWWPIILKLGARIEVRSGGRSIFAPVPERYPIGEDSAGSLTWHAEDTEVKFNRGKESYRIKRIALCYTPEQIADPTLRGVGVYRGGMKVPTIGIPRGKELREHIYGYVELGREIDAEIKRQGLEYPNHYGFKTAGIWAKISGVIDDEIENFINQKLSGDLSDQQKKNNQRTSAQNRALAILRNVTKGWPLSGTGVGPGGVTDDNDDETVKEIGVRLSNFMFPNPGNTPRLDYGQEVNGYYIQAFNKSAQDRKIHYELRLLSGDRTIELVDEGDLTLGSHKKTVLGKVHTLKATKESFPDPGEYRIKVSLLDAAAKKKTELDSIVRKIWIEEDPALTSPFDIEPRPFSEMDFVPDHIEWFLNPIGSGKYKLYYNLEHPTYLKNEDENQPRYLAEIFAQATVDLLIRRLKADESGGLKNNKKIPFDSDSVLSKDPERVYRETSQAMSKIRYEIDELIK